MTAPLLLVTGTGTGIGKTVVASALVRAWAPRTNLTVAGLKPIESGVAREDLAEWAAGGDVGELARVSTFDLSAFPPPYLLRAPVSPHLAARLEDATIDLDTVVAWTESVRRVADATVLELPGGLFSPLTDSLTNANLIRRLSPSRVVLVAPDRLGVLHDILAATLASRGAGVVIDGVILSAPAERDASTGTNEAELARILPRIPVLAVIPRVPAPTPDLAKVLDALGL